MFCKILHLYFHTKKENEHVKIIEIEKKEINNRMTKPK
jgi:hypothetical protein